ncbi:HlyIII-domain-containing protein [Hanseniaspora valbyensis NRRL Y-1626]|uniref:HlyIII-domain-containing protein n=1 Tax=Hanseniaspora valbyensis NRRL Y-1626 TaxID=766949 RepID=A0A1B7TCV7_9ASCO|nr:HlyIII-domain-containing protein [Hanseniaspora valbyensis NRRL Y-1626]
MDETTLFDGLELDLSKLDFVDIDESCISPISDTIDLLYPDEKLKTIAIEINTHNHLHCLETIKKRALHYYELPFPYRENKYVINGYRYYDFYDCSHLYHWHNETVNIWTHLLASFYFLYKLITFKNIYKTTAQNASISAFFLMSFSCFMLSSLWHTFSGWNKVKRRAKACCLDYSGISMLIVSSIIAVQCSIVPLENESFLQLYVWVVMSLSLLAMSLILNWHPKFDSPESRNKRILVFVSMAVVGNISIITLNPAKKGFHFFELFKNSFVWYLLGVVFYGGFLPERFRSDCPIGRIPTMVERNKELKLIKEERSIYFKLSPYSSSSSTSFSSSALNIDNSSSSWKSLWWTDYYLQSHNIWHLMVIMGCFGHLKAVETILDNMK